MSFGFNERAKLKIRQQRGELKFRDGGICEEGDALDAMNHFLEMIDHED